MSDTNRRSLLAITAAGAAAFTAGPALSQSASTSPRPSSGAGRTALVTGSSRGIGAATAKRLARDGFAVTVNYFTNRELAAQVVREIEAGGGRAIFRQADVADPAAVRALFDAHQEAFGGLDVVVNNAGAMNVAPFAQMTNDAFDRMMATNIKGSFNVLREAANRTRDGGAHHQPELEHHPAKAARRGCLRRQQRCPGPLHQRPRQGAGGPEHLGQCGGARRGGHPAVAPAWQCRLGRHSRHDAAWPDRSAGRHRLGHRNSLHGGCGMDPWPGHLRERGDRMTAGGASAGGQRMN